MHAMMRRLLCVCPVICTLWFGASAPAGTPIDVYVLSGQSNMVGSGMLSALDPELALQEDVLYHYSISLRPAEQTPEGSPEILASSWGPLRELSAEGHSYGLELAFGRAIADASDRPVAIIKTAINGAAIRHFTPSMKYWSFLGPYAQSAIEELEQLGYEPTVKAFVWVQGSSDANSPTYFSQYAAQLNILSDAVRDLWGDDLHIAQSQQYCCGPYLTFRINWVRQAKVSFTERDANATLTPADDLPMRSDDIHFSHRGLVELGERLAADVLGHVPEDLNRDGLVDAADLGMLIAQYGMHGASRSDLNGDRMVTAADIGILLASFGVDPTE